MTDAHIQLPEAVTGYLAAQEARNAPAAITFFARDATVADDGRTYRGRDEIRSWLETAASEYTYTTELVGVELTGDDRVTVTNHLAGDFPGGVVDLHYRFTLHKGQIAQLIIEP